MPFCKKCGFQLSDTASFCPRCGTAVSKQAVGATCPYCGQPVKAGSKFCQKCGGKLGASNTAASKENQGKTEPQAVITSICPGCRKPVKNGTKFCPFCGTAQPQPAQSPPLSGVPQKAVQKMQSSVPAATASQNFQPIGKAAEKTQPTPKVQKPKKPKGILILNLILSAACVMIIVAGIRIIPGKIQQVRAPVQVFEEVELGPNALREMEILESGGALIQPLPEEYVYFGHHNPEDWEIAGNRKEGEKNEK